MRLKERTSCESGVTMVEVIVVIGLLTIVLGFILQGFVSMQRAFQGDEIRLENLDQARQLMDTMSKDLRTATSLTAGTDPFLLADAREVRYYANLDNASGGPNLIHIYVRSDNALIEETTPPDAGSVAPNWTYNNGPTTIRLVGQYVANTATPIFTYYDDLGNALATPVALSSQAAIQSIAIQLEIRKSTNLAVPASTLINQVTLPNVYLTVIPSPSP